MPTSFHTAQVLIYYPYPCIVSHLTLLQRDFVPRNQLKGVDRAFMLFINLLSPILALRLSFDISFFSLRMCLKRYVNPETLRVISSAQSFASSTCMQLGYYVDIIKVHWGKKKPFNLLLWPERKHLKTLNRLTNPAIPSNMENTL